MSCRVLREGNRSRSPFCLFFTCLLLLAGLLPARDVSAFTAATLGDYQNVTVMEVSGNFDALDGYGQPNLEPRRAIAREFYRAHGDDYDFLVIFTSFNFLLPSAQTKAFFSPAKNDVRGIGLDLFDSTNHYSPNGAYLHRLEGTIDMANIASHVLEPANPEFDDTLRTLTHEMLHRWGAYVHFRDGDSASDALLGIDQSHWSFLLDAGGSSLYGNRWQDNGDGTFTSLAAEQIRGGEVLGRVLSPLELYLMGMIGKELVPPLLLIDAPGIDWSRLPEIGVTIPGTAKTVTIDDVIAVEGERLPAAATARKELRIAFVYAVTPGSWNETDPEALGWLSAINHLQREWESRFSILTDGKGMMHAGILVTESVAANPGVTEPTMTPAAEPSVNGGVAWLVGQQQANGSWQDQPGTALRDTAVAVTALKPFQVGSSGVAAGQAWLATVTPDNHDFLARQRLGLDSASPTDIFTRQNADGGWGGAPGFRSNPVDTALLLNTLSVQGGCTGSSLIDAAVAYLHAVQNADGGWNPGFGGSMVLPTAQALLALNACRSSYPLEPMIADGLVWLAGRQNADGGFGNSPSTVADTALALQAIKVSGGASTAADRAVGYLLAKQTDSGSWNASIFQTALAVAALHAAQVAADLTIETGDIAITPATVAVVPTNVTVTATVRNRGLNPVTRVKVSLYQDDPALNSLLGETIIDVPGKGSAPANFVVTVSEFGLHHYTVVVDGDLQIAEADEWNNTASKALAVNLPPPAAGFDLAASAGAESRTLVELAVSLGYPWPEPIAVDYVVSAASTATPATDYVLAAGSLVFAADQTRKVINLTVVNDLVAEIDKTVIVDLVNPSLGSLGTSRHTYTIRDDEAPSVTISSPIAGLIGQSAPQLHYTTTGGNVVVKVDGVAVGRVSGDPLDPLADGPHCVEVTASNSYGLATTARVDFAVDATLPTVIINAPASGTVTNSQPQLNFTSASAAGVEVLLDGVALSIASGDSLGPLADGMHTLTINAWNVAGSRSSAQVTFLVDARPPAVAIVYPGNAFIREVNPRLLCQVDEPGQTAVWLDGEETSLVIGEPLGPLSGGPHRLRVTVTDTVGNVGSAEVDFAVTIGDEAAYALARGWPGTIEGGYGGSDVDRAGNVYVVTRKVAKEFNLIKLDPAGNAIWTATASSFFNIMGAAWVDGVPKDLAVDSRGNIYIVGWGPSGSSNYGFLAKFDVNGRFVNHVLLDTGILYGDVYVFSVHVDADDQVYISGNTEYGLFAGEFNASATMFVAKYDSELTLLHGRSYGNPNDPASFLFADREAMTVDAEHNVYITGKSAANRLLAWKLNPDLTRSGIEMIGPDSSNGRSIGVDLFGNIYVGGQNQASGAIWKYTSEGQLAGGQSSSWAASSLVASSDGSVFLLDYNGYVWKFDHNLSLLWSVDLGTDFDAKLVMDDNGQLVVGGTYTTGSTSANIAKLADPRDPEFYFAEAMVHANSEVAVVHGYLEPGFTPMMEDTGLDLLSSEHSSGDGFWQMVVAGLTEGENRVAIAVTNAFGIKRIYETIAVVDTLAPRVEIVSPAAGSHWSSRPSLSYTASEGEVRVFVNGVDVTKRSGYPLDNLIPGENQIRVQSIDPAGNVGVADLTIFASGAAIGEYPLALGQIWKLGTAGDQTVVDAGQDAAGNLYVFGDTTQSFPDFAAGARDLYVAKYDPAGNLLNLWQFGSPLDDFGAGLAVTAAGEFLVAYNTDKLNASTNSMIVAKYAANGTLVWRDTLDSGAYDQINDLEIDVSGNVFACGLTSGRLNNKRFGGGQDYFLIKYSPSGSRVWTVLSNAATYEFLNDIELAGDGFIYATGRMNDDGSMSLFKFNATGGLVWKQDYRYANHGLSGEQLVIGQDGALYTLVESNYSSYYLVTKHDSQGNFVTAAVVQSPAIEELGLFIDADSNVYVTGYADDPYGNGWSLDGNPNFGDEDIFIAKYASTDLRKLWTRQFGDGNGQQGVEIVFNRVNGQAYLAGVTDGGFGGSSRGGQDVFVASLAALEQPIEPGLTIAAYRSPTHYQSVLLSGTVTSGAIVEAAIEAPTGSPAVLSPVVQHSDGTWHFTVNNLVPNADNDLTIRARDTLGTSSQRISITVDTLPPMLQIDPVASPLEQTSQLVTGSVEAGATLTVKLNQAPVQNVAVVDGGWSYMAAGLEVSDNVLSFAATDAAGNTTVRSITLVRLPPPPLSLVVNPVVLAETGRVDTTLSIGSVYPAGAVVAVEQVFDLDQNGVADADDPVVRRFAVTDGERSVNPNIPGDADGIADGTIVTVLSGQVANDRYHAAGQYVFTARTALDSDREAVNVVETVQPQSLHGFVLDEQGEPAGGALVELLDPWGRSFGFAMADAGGHYRFNIDLPGEYLPVPTAEGHAYARGTTLPVMVAAGQTMLQDLVVTTGAHQVSGRVMDGSTSAGLAGVMIRAENEHYLTMAMTATDGSFTLQLPDGAYRLAVATRPGDGLAAHGCLASSQSQPVISVSGDLGGQDLLVNAGTNLVCGVVTTAAGAGIPGAPLQALATDGAGLLAEASSDKQGNFCVALPSGGVWQVALDDAAAPGAGMVGTVGSTTNPDMTVFPLDSWIAGTVRDESGQPVAGVVVETSHGAGAGAAVKTDAGGRYLLGVSSEPAGDWRLGVYGEDLGYSAVEPVLIAAAYGRTVTRDFTLIQPRLLNTIVVTKAAYDSRKKLLNVEATSSHDNAQLKVVDYGPMTFTRLSKGKYFWVYSGYLSSRPETVTVSGPEGSATMAIR